MVFEDGFCFFRFLLRDSPPNGGVFFYLFLVVKDRALPTYLTYVMTTNQHRYPLRYIQGFLLSSSLFRIHSLC